ncbi:MAG: phosphosulfolactate synthase [Nocardioides sp.]
MTRPAFLSLPERSEKPRSSGLTHVLDKGLSVAATTDLLRSAGSSIDVWKWGWGTAYLDPELPVKLALLEAAQVRACLGGTMLEISWAQGRQKECLSWAAEVGFPMVEVSRGVVPMSLADKRDLIEYAAADFVVLSEVGSKDPEVAVESSAWHAEAASDLAAGAWKVVAEGRESGTVGLYDAKGAVRADVADALAEVAGAEQVLFEAPRKDQQAWLIRHFGPEVNLANIAIGEVMGVEALRLGLRADTVRLPSRLAPVEP